MIKVGFSWNGVKNMVKKFYPEAKAFKRIDQGTLEFKVGKELMTMRLSKEGFFFYDKRKNLVKKEVIPKDYDPWGDKVE